MSDGYAQYSRAHHSHAYDSYCVVHKMYVSDSCVYSSSPQYTRRAQGLHQDSSKIAMSARIYISSKFKGQASLCPPEAISAQSSMVNGPRNCHFTAILPTILPTIDFPTILPTILRSAIFPDLPNHFTYRNSWAFPASCWPFYPTLRPSGQVSDFCFMLFPGSFSGPFSPTESGSESGHGNWMTNSKKK